MADKRLLAQAKLSRSGIPPVPASASRDMRLFLEALRDNVEGNAKQAVEGVQTVPGPINDSDLLVLERDGKQYKLSVGALKAALS